MKNQQASPDSRSSDRQPARCLEARHGGRRDGPQGSVCAAAVCERTAVRRTGPSGRDIPRNQASWRAHGFGDRERCSSGVQVGWHSRRIRIVTWCAAIGPLAAGSAARPVADRDRAYPSLMGTMRPAQLESRLELADVGRLARRLLRRVAVAARTEDAPVQRALWELLGPQAADVPVVRATWPGYDRVNVQVGLDAWLAGAGRRPEPAGVPRVPPRPGIADLVQNEQWRGVRMGSPPRDLLPAGPGGVTLACLQCALCLVTDGQRPLALLVQAAGPEVSVEV